MAHLHDARRQAGVAAKARASPNESNGSEPLTDLNSYKGHPQPPVDERLASAKIFLADEDRNRHLNFEAKLAQIEEYLVHVEEKKLPANKDLLQDVKIMAKVQREWHDKFMDAPPADTTCCDTINILPYSTRLVDLERAAKLRSERDMVGLRTQMRPDEPPFTVKRSKDQHEFQAAMMDDATEDPSYVDEKTNLLYVENRAYAWALREPAMIPFWLDPQKGLSNSGLRPTDPQPAYRKIQAGIGKMTLGNAWKTPLPSPATPNMPKGTSKIPIPDYLKARQDKINDLLRISPVNITAQQSAVLQDLLSIHEPDEVARLHNDYDALVKRSRWAKSSVANDAAMARAYSAYQRAFQAWLVRLRKKGVKIVADVEGEKENTGLEASGIFAVPLQVPSVADDAILANNEKKINWLLGVFRQGTITDRNRDSLIARLKKFMPREVLDAQFAAEDFLLNNDGLTWPQFERMISTPDRHSWFQHQVKMLKPKDLARFQVLENDYFTRRTTFVQELSQHKEGVQLHFRLIGQLVTPEPGHLYRELEERYTVETQADLGYPPSHIRKFEADLNEQLRESQYFEEAQSKELEQSLQNVMFPLLRTLASKLRSWQRRAEQLGKALSPQETVLMKNDKRLYEEIYGNWLLGIRETPITIRMPQIGHIDEAPGQLIYRGRTALEAFGVPAYSAGNDPEQLIMRIKNCLPDFQANFGFTSNATAETSELYSLVADLQYPELLQQDINWRSAQRDGLRRDGFDFKDDWDKSFTAWIYTWKSLDISIREATPNEDRKWPKDDVRILYYRGPLPDPAVEGDSNIPGPIREEEMKFQQLAANWVRYSSVTDKEQAQINEILERYWQPAQEYRKYLSSKAKTDTPEEQQHQLREYENRRDFFLKVSSLHGFKIIKLPNGEFIAQETTGRFRDQWRVTRDSPSPETPPKRTDMKAVLDRLWPTRPLFNTAVETIQKNLSKRLNALVPLHPEAPFPNEEEYAQLLSLLRPFFPKSLRTLEENGMSEAFTTGVNAWIRGIARISAERGIQIRMRLPLTDRRHSDEISERVLFYDPPSTDVDMTRVSSTEDDWSPNLPQQFRPLQIEINSLLKKLAAGFATREVHDRLHVLLRAVMPPQLAEEDDRLMQLDAESRFSLLVGEKLRHFLADHAAWVASYDHWISTFGGKVKLRPKPSEGAPSGEDEAGVQYLQIKHPWDLPEFSSSQTLPQHLVVTNVHLNEDLRADLRDSNPQEQSMTRNLMKAHWSETYREALVAYLREDPEFGQDSEEVSSAIDARCSLAFEIWLAKARELVKSGRFTYELYEPRRMQPVLELLRLDANGEKVEVQNPERDNPPHFGPGWQAAKEDYFDLAYRLRLSYDSLSPEDLSKIAMYLQPVEGFESLSNPDGQRFLAILKRNAEGKIISQLDKVFATIVCSLFLWQTFSQQWPDLRRKVIQDGELPNGAVSALLNRKVSLSEPTYAPGDENLESLAQLSLEETDVSMTDAEIESIAVEINSLLTRYKAAQSPQQSNGTPLRPLSPQEESLLDYFLRPLIRGRLAEQARTIARLIVTSHFGNGMTVDKAILLNDCEKQFDIAFRNFKDTIPAGSVILNPMYHGRRATMEVIRRYRAWQQAYLEDNNKPATPPIVSSRDQSTGYQNQFKLLQDFVSKDAGTVSSEELFLEHVPPHLQTIGTEFLLLKGEAEQRSKSGQTSDQAQLLLLDQARMLFVHQYMEWFNQLSQSELEELRQTLPSKSKVLVPSRAVDFTAKAERRGIQRAAIELALNILVTNQEQHRPKDRFRRVKLPRPYKFPLAETPLWLPLEPWKRPLELDTFHFTKLLQRYRAAKDEQYEEACELAAAEAGLTKLRAPVNYAGPSSLLTGDELWQDLEFRRGFLIDIQGVMFKTCQIAPRPLLDRLARRLNEGLTTDPESRHQFLDEVPLSVLALNAFQELSEPSWREDIIEFAPALQGYPAGHEDATDPYVRAEFFKFVDQVEQVLPDIPFWRPRLVTNSGSYDENDPAQFVQTPYNRNEASEEGWTLEELLDAIDVKISAVAVDGPEPEICSDEEAVAFLRVLHTTNRVNFDPSEHGLISRIPPSGHPENKYVVSEAEAEEASKTPQHAPHIRASKVPQTVYVPESKSGYEEMELKVQLDSNGTIGKPIVQPNKFDFLQRTAFRIGRDIADLTRQMGNMSLSPKEMLKLQKNAREGAEAQMADLEEEKSGEVTSLPHLAAELHGMAPDLIQEARAQFGKTFKFTGCPTTINDRQAGQLIQNQIIEEANNNWDMRFAEKEHLWDFAAPRLTATVEHAGGTRTVSVKPPQFFSMRRWPLACQGQATQALIQQDGPIVLEKVAPPKDKDVRVRTAPEVPDKKPVERHTGRGFAPHFPFGETPYQQAYKSWEIEQDLKDVEEFNPKPVKTRWSTFVRKWWGRKQDSDDYSRPQIDRFALPKIPEGWTPDSVPLNTKARDITERLMTTPGASNDPEYYYDAGELRYLEAEEQAYKHLEEVADATRAVEKHIAPWDYDELSRDEIRKAQLELGIDPVSGRFKEPPTPVVTLSVDKTGVVMGGPVGPAQEVVLDDDPNLSDSEDSDDTSSSIGSPASKKRSADGQGGQSRAKRYKLTV